MKDYTQCATCIHDPLDPAPDTYCDDCNNGSEYIENSLLVKTSNLHPIFEEIIKGYYSFLEEGEI